ncbi:MAG: hypothetical protein ACOH5I_16535 [Oligoflexus sp.]
MSTKLWKPMSTKLWKHFCMTLFSVSYLACQQDIGLERRIPDRDSEGLSSENSGNAEDTINQDIVIDPGFSPGDPNVIPASSSGGFPNLAFSLAGVPSAASDYHQFEFPIEADPAFSHYAYKLDNLGSCEESGGYTVHDISNPLQISVADLADGMVYLCVISFHFPTKKWQSLASAHVFNWEKLPFERTISSYYVYDNSPCNRSIRFQAELNISGSAGSYTWVQERVPGCPADTNPVVDQFSQIKVENDVMTGLWHEGTTIAGWFEFKFTNNDRTEFTGTWGFGQPGVKVEGVWNSNPQ